MAEFLKPKICILKVDADLDPDDLLVRVGETLRGKKTRVISINGFKVDGSLDDALLVLNKILGDIVNTSFNTNSVRKVVTEKLAIEYVEVIFLLEDIEPIFNDTYRLQGNNFTAADIEPIFNGTYRLQGTTFTAADIDLIFC